MNTIRKYLDILKGMVTEVDGAIVWPTVAGMCLIGYGAISLVVDIVGLFI